MTGYTVAQAAKALGRSDRLVRKLISEGRIDVVPDSKPLRVTEASVHRERNQRRNVPPPSKSPTAFTVDEVEALVQRAVSAALSETLPKMLEARDSSEALLRDEVARLHAELEAMKAATGQEQAAARRRWWNR